ncbi:hypothetical protein ACLESO_27350, partial [Pyxidicoccus sp. 3LG]
MKWQVITDTWEAANMDVEGMREEDVRDGGTPPPVGAGDDVARDPCEEGEQGPGAIASFAWLWRGVPACLARARRRASLVVGMVVALAVPGGVAFA